MVVAINSKLLTLNSKLTCSLESQSFPTFKVFISEEKQFIEAALSLAEKARLPRLYERVIESFPSPESSDRLDHTRFFEFLIGSYIMIGQLADRVRVFTGE